MSIDTNLTDFVFIQVEVDVLWYYVFLLHIALIFD